MTQFATADSEARNNGIANGREIGAYAIAQAIKLVLSFGLSLSGLLSPLYGWAYRNGGVTAIVPLTVAISVFWAVMVLGLFLGLRGALGGVPAIIGGPGRQHSVTTSGGEIGAYISAAALSIAALTVLNGVLGRLYVSLGESGQRSVAIAVAFLVSAVGVVIVYAVFIGLRSLFCRR